MRRSKKYIEYDYEAAYDKQLHSLEEANLQRMLEEGKVKSIYATKEIRAGEQLEVEIYPEFLKSRKGEIPKEGLKDKRRQAQKNLNEKNSRKECVRLLNRNFNDRDIWATLTYSDDNMPESMERAYRNMKNYITRLKTIRKKMGLPALRYIYITECSEKGRWHHHIVMDGDMGLDVVEATWHMGGRNQVRRLEKDENGLSGMANYITKQKRQNGGKYQKSWTPSKNLKKPKVDKNHYKFKQRDVDEVVTGRQPLEDKLNRWYEKLGYKLYDFEVRYNIFNGRFYISARLYRLPDKFKNRKERLKE